MFRTKTPFVLLVATLLAFLAPETPARSVDSGPGGTFALLDHVPPLVTPETPTVADAQIILWSVTVGSTNGQTGTRTNNSNAGLPIYISGAQMHVTVYDQTHAYPPCEVRIAYRWTRWGVGTDEFTGRPIPVLEWESYTYDVLEMVNDLGSCSENIPANAKYCQMWVFADCPGPPTTSEQLTYAYFEVN